jgi:hypothetical protein
MHPSGQYTQQIWQVTRPALAAMHSVWSMTGRLLRHWPVAPASPTAGRDMEI